jgi:YD repeat-containing protein
MIAYKATYGQKCISIKYEVGKTYTFNGEIAMCDRGFHFCVNPKDTLNYYAYNKDYILMEIEVLGKVIKSNDKCVTDKLKIIRIIPKEETNQLMGIIKEYDANGNLVHSKDFKGFEEWTEFDSNNKIIHHKNSEGYEYWIEYDNNNLIHYKNSTGNEYWQDFDKNNSIIHSKDNKGIETRRIFDSNNNLIEFKSNNPTDSPWSITIE